MNEQIINREASDKTKGFRLQKLRAIKLMLQTLEHQDSAIFYTAIENIEDVSHTIVSGENVGTYYEEDKDYNEKHRFTIFSPPVTNTLVSFFDIYVGAWRGSNDVKLGFYTTARIGKEKNKFKTNGTEVDPPEKPILEYLSSGIVLSDNVVKIVKSVVVAEYRKQYSAKDSKGYLTTLMEMNLGNFRGFLNKIEWHFEGEDEKMLKPVIINMIKKSKLHNVRIANKEESVLAILMEMLDERQTEKSLVRSIVTGSDVKLAFKQAESENSDSVMDPTWEELKKIEKEITDKRNLPEKITSVCPNYDNRKLQYLARLACRSKTEQKSSDRSFLSLKYRIYEACSEYFFQNNKLLTTEAEVDKTIDELNKKSIQHIAELKKDYFYSISNSQVYWWNHNGFI